MTQIKCFFAILTASGALACAGARPLPPEIQKDLECHLRVNPKDECNDKTLGVKKLDLDGAGDKEMILGFGGGSCGKLYWIYKKNHQNRWELLGKTCSMDFATFKAQVLKESHGGYRSVRIHSGDSEDILFYSPHNKSYRSLMRESDRVTIALQGKPCKKFEEKGLVEVSGENLDMSRMVNQFQRKAAAIDANEVHGITLNGGVGALIRFMMTLKFSGPYKAIGKAVRCSP